MKFFMTLSSGREIELEVLERSPGHARLLVNGREIEADFRDVDRLGQYAVGIDGRSYAASIEQHSPTDLGVTIAGESFRVQAVDESERAADALTATRPKAETILASMPGIVVAVYVETGQLLEAGAPVLMLEAMKMQNEICSEYGGLVEDVLVRAGESVAGNEVLVKLAPTQSAE